MAANTQVSQDQYLDQGTDIFQLIGQGGNVLWSINNKGGVQVVPQPITASGAINPRLPGFYVITKAGVAAMTLAAPTATTDDGLEIEVSSTTAFAHSFTATGLLLPLSGPQDFGSVYHRLVTRSREGVRLQTFAWMNTFSDAG